MAASVIFLELSGLKGLYDDELVDQDTISRFYDLDITKYGASFRYFFNLNNTMYIFNKKIELTDADNIRS